MSEIKINLEEIVMQEWKKYPDNHIDIKSVAGIALLQKIIMDCMRESCKQALELAAVNIKSDAMETYGSDVPDCWSEESILNTINQIE